MSVKERPRLGRGLADVSRHFLERRGLEDGHGGPHSRREEALPRITRICVFHATDVLMQEVLAANLALEAARRRFHVTVYDTWDVWGQRVRDVTAALITDSGEGGPDNETIVALYGLPPILIRNCDISGMPRGESLEETDFSEHAEGVWGRVVVVSPTGPIGCLAHTAGMDHHVFVTGVDEPSLLRCYAALTVVCASKTPGRLWMVFEHDEQTDCRAIFTRFNTYVAGKLGIEVGYLGELARDDALERSIRDARPVVLVSGPSRSKDAMERISSCLLDDQGPA